MDFINLINNNESNIIRILLDILNKEKNFIKYYVSKDIIKKSILNLNKIIIKTYKDTEGIFEIYEDYKKDQTLKFGALIFKIHFKKSVKFDDFFSIIKKFRQAYIKITNAANLEIRYKEKYLCFINRFFDKIEIGISLEWAKISKESEDKFQKIFHNAKDAMFVHKISSDNMPGNFIEVNEIACNKFEYKEKEYKLITPLNMIKSEKHDYIGKIMKKILKERNVTFEIDLLTKKGSYVPVEINSQKILINNQKIVLSIARDISERKKTERLLRESEERYRKLFELIPDAVIVHSNGEILLANQAAAKLLKFTPNDLKGKSIFDFLHMDYWGTAMGRIKKTLDENNDASMLEYKCIRSDKKIVDVEVTSTSFYYIEKPAMLSVIRDITERKILEEEYQINEKLKSLGILAGGIAHDFNNILTIIQGNISLLKVQLKNNGVKHDKLNEVKKAINQAKNLTRQLLTFSNGGEPDKKKMQLENLIKDAVTLCISGSNVSCEFIQNEKLFPVEIDSGQISQVLNNLIINAVQSMSHGGKIYINSENIIISNYKLETDNELKAGNYVKISIKDEGAGISSESYNKIFDPFYTTKDNGTGLGLTTALSIMKKHEGLIRVNSTFGVGTTIILYFPASKSKKQLSNIEKKKITYTGSTGRGKVLLMDDNYAVREVLGQMLSNLGYNVDYAEDGEEAILLFKKHLEVVFYDVIILDLTVPGGKGGLETIEEILNMDPNARVIVSSGYSDSPIKSKYKEYGFKDFISKPFDMEKLSEVLQKVLKL